MNQEQLRQMRDGKGFIAALDQSGGSTPKALKLYGIDESAYSNEEEMFDAVHAMRTRIIKSPAFTSDRILGAILFEMTMNRTVDGILTADYLWEKKHIVPFLKVDNGLDGEQQGVQLMKPIPDLDKVLQCANERHIFGTKMRSVIKSANPDGIRAVVNQQFDLAIRIISAGLVPIIEPEVDIHSADKVESERLLKIELTKHIALLDNNAKVMLKLSIPSEAGYYSDFIHEPKVIRVVALSGGYTRDVANTMLSQNPGLIASFSRALSEGLNVKQTDAEFDTLLKQSIDSIYDASTK